MSGDIIARLHARPMNRFQVSVIFTCLLLNVLDGFDVLAMSFTAPEVRAQWRIGEADIGFLISAGLAGMTLGSLFISPFADKIGRRGITLICLAVITVGMLLSGFSQDLTQLSALRFITGLGIGGMLPSLNTLVAEYSSDKRRDFAIGAFSIGYPIGVMIGGIVSVFLVTQFSWRGVFIFGGVLSAVLFPFVAWRLPESLDFLLLRRPPDALKRLNAILRRLGDEELTELPPLPARKDNANKVIDVLGPKLIRSTVLICSCYFMVMLTSYFLLGWLPTLLVDMGLSVRQGISGSIVLGLGGIAGGLAFGWLSSLFGMRLVAPAFMVISFLGLIAFALLPEDITLLMPVGAATGFFMIGSTIALYALAPLIFPAAVRATGTGLSIGVGRIGAIAGPLAFGLLAEAGLDLSTRIIILAVPMLVAAVLISQIKQIKGVTFPARRAGDLKA